MNPFALPFKPDKAFKGVLPHSGIQPGILETPFGVRN